MSGPVGSPRAQRGLTMIEVLVAFAVLAIAVVIALVLYDAARKSFKKGENATEQQQAVRIAFDKLNSDLRMAGYNYNPDGDMHRPDEQIEGAFDTAIVLRADFDVDTADATSPETALATGGAYNTVSTGNDEVVAYVLGKPDGSSTDTLTFYADFNSPRNGTVQRIDVPNVALIQNNPPYTLYRVTFSNTNGSPIKTALVDNVRTMTFRYFTQGNTQVNSTFDLTSTADDIGGADTATALASRDSIRRVTVSLVGLTRDPDLGWSDATDTNPNTRAYRKFELTGDVTPRNLGMKGIKDLMADVVPPSAPGAPTLYAGHCGGLYVTWPANPSGDGVASYRLNYGTVTGSPTGQRSVTATSCYVGSLADNTVYYLTIQALDAAGNVSAPSSERNLRTTNTTTPKAPTNLAGTSNLNGSVRLTWNAVAENTGNVAGDPESPMIRDLAGYRVYRDTTATSTAPVQIANETHIGPMSSPLYLDIGAINCRQFYYWTSAVDGPCALEGAKTTAVAGMATSSVKPAPPQGVQAFVAGAHAIKVTWQATTKDVNGSQISIEKYKVWRSRSAAPSAGDPTGLQYDYIGQNTVPNLYYVDDPAPAATSPGERFFYRVSALDDCPNESDLSNAASAACSFSGTVSITSPADGTAVAGVVAVSAEVTGGTDTYTKATFTYTNASGSVTRTQDVVGPGPTWTDNWMATPAGTYTITVTVENTQPCYKSATISVTAGDVVGCCLSPPNPTQNPVDMTCAGGSMKCKEVTYLVINNGCRTAVSVEAMTITWADVVGNGAKLASVLFDGGTIWSVSPYSPSPASTSFSDPKPVIALNRTSTNPVQVTYIFDQVTGDKVHGTCVRDTMTTTYQFRLLDQNGQPTSIQGTCGPGQGMFGNLLAGCP